MKLFLLLLAGLTFVAMLRPNRPLHDFDAQSTFPLRGLLAIFIVLHHLSQSYDFSEVLWGIPISPLRYFTSMGAPVVAVFFLLTGYGLARSIQLKGNAYLDGFIPKRLGKILPEFLILTLLMVCVIIYRHSFETVVANMKAGTPPLYNSWFIYIIIYAYIAFYFSAIISNGNIKKTGLIFTAFIMANVILLRMIGYGAWWWQSTMSVALGFFIACNEDRITKLLAKPYILGGLVLMTIVYLVMLTVFNRGGIIGIYIIAAMTYVCMRLYKFPRYSWLIFLGGISMNIYLVHGIVLACSFKIGLSGYVAVVIVLVLSCIAAYIMKISRTYAERRLTYYSSERRKIEEAG